MALRKARVALDTFTALYKNKLSTKGDMTCENLRFCRSRLSSL